MVTAPFYNTFARVGVEMQGERITAVKNWLREGMRFRWR